MLFPILRTDATVQIHYCVCHWHSEGVNIIVISKCINLCVCVFVRVSCLSKLGSLKLSGPLSRVHWLCFVALKLIRDAKHRAGMSSKDLYKQNVCYMGHRRNKDHVTWSCKKVPTKTILEKDSWVSFLALQTLMPTEAKLFLAWLYMLKIQHPLWFRVNTYSWREYLPGTALWTGF